MNWVLRTTARELGPGELSARLTGIVGENLGCLDLTDFPPDDRKRIQIVLRSSLVGVASLEFPDDLKNQTQALEHLQSLADSC